MNILLELLEQRGVSPQKVAGTYGGEFHSPCPGCGGEDRFHVWPEQNNGDGSYWCRQCGKGGDAIQFLIDFEGLSFHEACERLNRPVPAQQKYQTPRVPHKKSSGVKPKQVEHESPSNLWLEKANALVEWAHQNLLKSSAKLKWLFARGIKKKTVKQFRLGWNPGKDGKDLWRPRESWGLDTVMIGKRKKRLWIPAGLVIPLIDDKGHVLRIRIRRTKGKPSYYVIPGSAMPCMVFGQGGRAFVIVESELDAILLDQEVGHMVGVVATGSSSAKPDATANQALKAAPIILNALDYDTAGAKALAWWEKNFPQSERWPVPQGKDPGEAWQAGVDLVKWVCAGLPSGWHVGPCLEKVKKERGAKQETKHVSGDAELPEAILELAELLKVHPVSIYVTPQRVHLRHPQKWARQNWDVSKRISELVFMIEEVMDFLDEHPKELIDGNNIIKGVRHG